jgi:hypothetical protein
MRSSSNPATSLSEVFGTTDTMRDQLDLAILVGETAMPDPALVADLSALFR